MTGGSADATAPERLALLVVNYGSSDLLRTNLAATAAELPGAIVVVVDNWKDAAERAAVTAVCEEFGWSLVPRDDNGGFGVGMDAGAARARELGAQWLLLLNPDLELGGESVHRMLEAARSRPLALVGPRILRPDGSVWTIGHDLYLDDGRIRSVRRRLPDPVRRRFWISGACLLLSVELWDRIGGFAPDYFLYWEDVELSHRAEDVGAELVLCDDAVAVHHEGGTQGVAAAASGAAKSTTYYYYNTRNRLVYAARNLDDRDLAGWMREARAVEREILLQGGRKQLLRSLAPLRAVRKGTRDGLERARQEQRDRAQRATSSGDAVGSADS